MRGFADRKGQPRPFSRGEIRRIIANWPEYGSLYWIEKLKIDQDTSKKTMN